MSEYEAVVKVRYVVDDSQIRAAQSGMGGGPGGGAPGLPGPGGGSSRAPGMRSAVGLIGQNGAAGYRGTAPGQSLYWPNQRYNAYSQMYGAATGQRGWRGMASYLPQPQNLFYDYYSNRARRLNPGASEDEIGGLAGIGSGRMMGRVLKGGAAAAGIGVGLGMAVHQFHKAATNFGQAVDKFVHGITSGDATTLLYGGAQLNLFKAYAMSGAMTAGGTLAGAGIGAMIGGPVGAGIGGAVGGGAGMLAGAPGVISASLQMWFQKKLFSALDGLVDSVKKWNYNAAAWSAAYTVKQIQFNLSLGNATSGLVGAWMNLKIKVLDAWMNSLPAMQPLFTALAGYLNSLTGAVDQAVPAMLDFVGVLLDAAGVIGKIAVKIGGPLAKGMGATALSPTAGLITLIGGLFKNKAAASGTAGSIGSSLHQSAANIRADSAQAAALKGMSPAQQQAWRTSALAGGMDQARVDAIMARAGLGSTSSVSGMLGMDAWRTFFKSHVANVQKMRGLDVNSKEYANLVGWKYDGSANAPHTLKSWMSRHDAGMTGLHMASVPGLPMNPKAPPAAAGAGQSGINPLPLPGLPFLSTLAAVPKGAAPVPAAKPPAATPAQKTAQPHAATLKPPEFAMQVKTEIKLANDALMHQAVAQMREALQQGQRKQFNEICLYVNMFDTAYAGGMF